MSSGAFIINIIIILCFVFLAEGAIIIIILMVTGAIIIFILMFTGAIIIIFMFTGAIISILMFTGTIIIIVCRNNYHYSYVHRSKAGKRKTKVKKHTLNPVFEEILRV